MSLSLVVRLGVTSVVGFGVGGAGCNNASPIRVAAPYPCPSASSAPLQTIGCPVDTVFIRGGEFRRSERLPRLWAGTSFFESFGDFCIDRTEVTVAAYRDCVSSKGCAAAGDGGGCTGGLAEGSSATPINCVSWTKAAAYCATRQRQLPSAMEFEWARRGGQQEWIPPWAGGSAYDHACLSGNKPCAVATFAAMWGVSDLTGNVSEWTSTLLTDERYLVAGGDFATSPGVELDAGVHHPYEPTKESRFIGFRCVLRRG